MLSKRKGLAFFAAAATLIATFTWFFQDYKFRHPYAPLFFSIAALPAPATPAPSPTRVVMYRAVDVGQRGIPAIDPLDKAELDAAVRHGVAKRGNIWWAYGGKTSGDGFVMVETDNPNQAARGAYKIVTGVKEKCANSYYDPVENRAFATMMCQ